jgi:predicted flap endonuclease-1-like 5' DNA nuclease
MADQTGRLRCQAGCWIAASVIGVLATVLSVLTIEISVPGAIFVGALVGAALGVILSLLMCQPLPPPKAAGTAPTVGRGRAAVQAMPASAPAPAPAPAPEAAQSGPPEQDPAAAAPDAASQGTPPTAVAVTDAGAVTAGAASADETPPAEATVDAPQADLTEPTEADKPLTLDGPRDGGADDLKQIKGVGPKLEKLLHSMGFYHFDQIAAWTGRELAWVDGNLDGFKGRATRDDWVGQARTLAGGGSTAFSDKVKGGDVY